jgi:uncharacterized protein (TIGR03663 family)
MHHDEAYQAYRFGTLLETGTYEYDSFDHHGPTLYYLTLPVAWLSGAHTFADTNEVTYRLLPVIFGLLLILCLPLLRSGIGTGAVLAAALLAALSPAMAYYSRFYIQEILLVCFTGLVIACGWQALQAGSRVWALIGGIAAGLMFATKETAVIAYASMAGAALICAVSARKQDIPYRLLWPALLGAVLVSIILYSSFFTHPRGPLESVLAFKGYFARGTGVDTDHVHPWNFYLRMLTFYRFEGGPVWSEGLITALGLVGAAAALRRRLPAAVNPGLALFLTAYTLLMTFIYSAIAYKTPWCILSMLHGWILLAGIGAAVLFEITREHRPGRTVVLLLLLIGCAQLTRTAHRTVFRYAADYRNPYVYAHTVPDVKKLVARIEALRETAGVDRELYLQVVADPQETWPLPFYLRTYPDTGYWVDRSAVPPEPQADIIIASADYEADPSIYLSEYYGLRADTLLSVHIRRPLWDRFIESRR